MATKTLAQRRAAQARAVKDAAKPASAGQAPAGRSHTYNLLLLKLAEDKRALKAIESIDRKIALKHELLPHYVEWVSAVLQNGTGGADQVLMTVMLWRIDVGDFAGALAIGRYALAHDLNMPDVYKRKTPTVLAEEIADTAKSMLTNQQDLDQAATLQLLLQTYDLTRDCDMANEVRAKLHRVIGFYAEPLDPPLALLHFKEAYRLHEKCGVKSNINRLEKLVNPVS
ncbi:MAG: phage terminase small subunit [Pseudomonadota bacterium]|nr:phage terminase small subunit [Pseudomonadota bacterium]